jgi:PAS domain S-box-containing protein
MEFLSKLLDVASADPSDARRRKLLNILILGIIFLTLLAFLGTVFADVTDMYDQKRINILYLGSLANFAGLAVAFLLNRYGPGWLASLLFLVVLTLIFAYSDEPRELVMGRSLLFFAIPILISSMILHPRGSFITAALISILLVTIALRTDLVPSIYGIIGLFVIALVAWLVARSLERALKDLWEINRELDRRVVARTRELADALNENQAILEGIADGIIVFDQRGEAVVANPAIAYLLNRPVSQIVGQNIRTMTREHLREEHRGIITGLLSGKEYPGTSLNFEWGEKTLSVNVAPIRDEMDRPRGTVAVFRDFTREAEINRMKSAFVSVTSHELRTPLNAILGYADMLRETIYGPLTEKQSEVMDRIIANTGHLLNIVNNLLDQAQIEAGRMTLRLTSFALADLIEGVESVMTVLAHSKGLELTSCVEEDMPARLSGDWQRLRQVLLNLVDNAIKYTNDGTVSIRAYRLDSVHWALEVSDTGVGIPIEAQAQIFDAFQRVDDSVTRERAGAGLGLSIVKQLVTLMGGEIKLTSAEGEGSTFTVILPLVTMQEELLESTAQSYDR